MIIPKFLMVKNTKDKGNSLVTVTSISKGEVIFKFLGDYVSRSTLGPDPNRAIQVDEDIYLESKGCYQDFTNHSCNPNAFISSPDHCLVALRDIKQGEEITFNYNASEYDLIDQGCSFQCSCKSENCVGEIKGFKYLNIEQKFNLSELLSPYLLSTIKNVNNLNNNVLDYELNNGIIIENKLDLINTNKIRNNRTKFLRVSAIKARG